MESLQDYGGTLVFVSHDRYFLDGLATKVLEIGNRTAIPYLGNYEDYLLKKAELERVQTTPEEKPGPEDAPASAGKESDDQPGLKKKKPNPYKINKVKEQIDRLEAQIQLHETRIAVLNQLLSSAELYRDHQLFRSTMEEHDRLQLELSRYMEEWERLHSELELLRAGPSL
jgi:ATP-binding cassette subfamily F protein 3